MSSIDPRSLASWSRHLGRPVDGPSVRRDLAAGTIHGLAARTARQTPRRLALRVEDRVVTHGELDDAARRFAAWLRRRGVDRGARVLLAGPTSIRFVVAYLGVLHAGGTATFASPNTTAVELDRIVEDAHPVVACVTDGHVAHVRDLRGAGGPVRAVCQLDGDEDGLLPGIVVAASPATVDSGLPGDVAHLAFTSGTTGRPKATPLTHANLLASIRAVMWAWRWSADDVLVHALPLVHGHGLSGVQAVAISGASAVLLPRFDPERLCRTIAAERGTVLFAVPAIWERLLDWDGVRSADLTSLRLATSGSAPLSPTTAERVAEVLGERPLERYGCTETGYTLSNPLDGARRPGTVGFALPGAEVRVVDADGAVVDDGVDGEVVVRGPQVFAGYEGAPTSEAFHAGGWFRTGDIGRVDPADGYVSITGRSKDVIITGGVNVYPREVELALEVEPEVAAAAVVGVPSSRWGEEVTAFVVPAGGGTIDVARLDRRMRSRLAPHKRPKRTVVVERLPRNHLGKVLRTELVERALRDRL